MVVESTCKENYFNWYRELVTVVYQGRGWVHAGKEEYFNHRHCLKLLAQGDNKKLTDLCLVLLFVLNPYHLHMDGFYHCPHPLVYHWLAF